MWTSEITDTLPFSIFLINANISDLKQFAVANNVDPRLGKKDVEIGANMNYTGFQLIFTDIGNINSIYATSETFEIKEAVLHLLHLRVLQILFIIMGLVF
ncbi:16424_t:CDS:2 [Rhizophagus irregularis]|nr:16424_t:CDS:2 [Rhizophagus irregularis]